MAPSSFCNLLLLPLYGYLAALLWKLLHVSKPLLLSVITGLCIGRFYAINHEIRDIWVMAGMGVLAYALKRGGFPLAQIVLGMVLGPLLEQNFIVSAIKSRWDITSFFDRPLALGLMLATLVIIGVGIRFKHRVGANT